LKATQTPRGPIQVPDASLDGGLQLVFLVHGIRHVDPQGVRVAGLRAGHPLFVTAEDDTPVNSLAVLVSDRPAVTRNTSLSYVPDSMRPLAPTRCSDHVAVPRGVTREMPSHHRHSCKGGRTDKSPQWAAGVGWRIAGPACRCGAVARPAASALGTDAYDSLSPQISGKFTRSFGRSQRASSTWATLQRGSAPTRLGGCPRTRVRPRPSGTA
jgi:hypothetical protein